MVIPLPHNLIENIKLHFKIVENVSQKYIFIAKILAKYRTSQERKKS